MNYNIWNKWDTLETCMVGNNYFPEFFDGVDPKAGDPLKRICEETLEDIDNFKDILKQFGVTIIQPTMDPAQRFLDNPSEVPRGPLQPRDHFLVLGNDCYITGNDHPAIYERLCRYGKVIDIRLPADKPTPLDENFYNKIKGEDFPCYDDFVENRLNEDFFLPSVWDELVNDFKIGTACSSANSMMIGKKFFIGKDSDIPFPYSVDELNTFGTGFSEFDIEFVDLDGHVDGNFHPIKPGAILSLYDIDLYKNNFPGWDVCYLPDQSWNNLEPFLELKKQNQGKWWLAGEEDNSIFTNFVETWLSDWVGYVEETVFDVNVLMLDEHHCCVTNIKNEQVNSFFKKHKVEPVYVPWRHRFFWDGGLHCITLDLKRKGTQKEYLNG